MLITSCEGTRKMLLITSGTVSTKVDVSVKVSIAVINTMVRKA